LGLPLKVEEAFSDMMHRSQHSPAEAALLPAFSASCFMPSPPGSSRRRAMSARAAWIRFWTASSCAVGRLSSMLASTLRITARAFFAW